MSNPYSINQLVVNHLCTAQTGPLVKEADEPDFETLYVLQVLAGSFLIGDDKLNKPLGMPVVPLLVMSIDITANDKGLYNAKLSFFHATSQEEKDFSIEQSLLTRNYAAALKTFGILDVSSAFNEFISKQLKSR